MNFVFPSSADEKVLNTQSTELNIYTGMFDFSDDGKKSTLIGFEHQDENLNRDTFLGNLSPITGILITTNYIQVISYYILTTFPILAKVG